MTPPSLTTKARTPAERPRILIGDAPLTTGDVEALATGRAEAALNQDQTDLARREDSRRVFEESVTEGKPCYGVTTGVGASVSNVIPETQRVDMARNLYRFHGCGTGEFLSEAEAAAVLTIRLATFARGASAVRSELLDQLLALLNTRVLPCIPEEGSVGASGDLTPLSYVAALVAGEREALVGGTTTDAAEALAQTGLEPLALAPKESLALMNGTAVMTAIATLAVERVERLCRLACTVTAMVSDATHGNPEHFDARIAELKPHPGSVQAAAWIRAFLDRPNPSSPARLQDPYSVRCAPQIIGVALDALASARRMIEIEINGVDDNPIVHTETQTVLHGGNFYGGHVAFAADSLKACVAGVADLLDRQLVLLCTPETSDGLPENLVGVTGPGAVAHHGFKAMQITASALTAEALKATMPAASFSRSTESHNQDKVSMGTIAARDLRRVVDLTETVVAITVLAACQAMDLRSAGLDDETREVPAKMARLHAAVRAEVEPVTEDRRQDHDIAAIKTMIGNGLLDFLD